MPSIIVATTAADVNLNRLFGGVLWGLIFATFAFGCLFVQSLRYFRLRKEANANEPGVTALVCVVLSLDVAHSALLFHDVYLTFVSNFGIYTIMDHVPWSGQAAAVPQALIAVVVQGYYSYRIKKFSGSLILPVTNWILAIARLAFTLFATILSIQIKSFIMFSGTYSWTIATCVVIGVLEDILIAGGMTYYLRKRRKEGALPQNTQDVLYSMMLLGLEGGALTTCVGVAYLVSLLTIPASSIWITFYFLLAKTYSNSLLANLNSRHSFRARLRFSSNVSPPSLPQSTDSSAIPMDVVQIRVHKEDVSRTDSFSNFKSNV